MVMKSNRNLSPRQNPPQGTRESFRRLAKGRLENQGRRRSCRSLRAEAHYFGLPASGFRDAPRTRALRRRSSWTIASPLARLAPVTMNANDVADVDIKAI